MKKILVTFSIFLAVVLAAGDVVFAGSATSTNYKVVTGDSASKGYASSTNYKAYTSTGQAAPVGVSSSASYIHQAGFIRRLLASSPNLNLIVPDINGDGFVNVINDILTCGRSFGSPSTNPNYNSACDMNADNFVNVVDDILGVANAFGTSKWPPANSPSQPLVWTLGKKLTLYDTALPDTLGRMPTLTVSASCNAAATSFISDEFLGKKRGRWEWTPNISDSYVIVFSANYVDSTTNKRLDISIP